MNRRNFLIAGAGLAASTSLGAGKLPVAGPNLRVTGFELLPVRATERTVWLFVRLRTDVGLTGLGEASEDADRMRSELRGFFELIEGKTPLDIGAYRQRGEGIAAKGDLVSATAFGAIEQALWDLAGKALEVPTCTLFGGRVRDSLDSYANINRATKPRTPEGFARIAKAAAQDGFRAIKAAPFDGFPAPGSSQSEIDEAVEIGIASVSAMREAVGPNVELMVDCHSFFDVTLAERVAHQLEPQDLAWYEEPVPPERVEDTREINQRIQQPMAGGELLYGVAGFAPLSRDRAVDVIMPDVKHCGGLLEMTRIAAVAEADNVTVAPHNPSGPVSTAGSIQICAVLRNFRLLEFQWGEVDWRSEILDPPEQFENGTILVPERPGFGIELNEKVVSAHLM